MSRPNPRQDTGQKSQKEDNQGETRTVGQSSASSNDELSEKGLLSEQRHSLKLI